MLARRKRPDPCQLPRVFFFFPSRRRSFGNPKSSSRPALPTPLRGQQGAINDDEPIYQPDYMCFQTLWCPTRRRRPTPELRTAVGAGPGYASQGRLTSQSTRNGGVSSWFFETTQRCSYNCTVRSPGRRGPQAKGSVILPAYATVGGGSS